MSDPNKFYIAVVRYDEGTPYEDEGWFPDAPVESMEALRAEFERKQALDGNMRLLEVFELRSLAPSIKGYEGLAGEMEYGRMPRIGTLARAG